MEELRIDSESELPSQMASLDLMELDESNEINEQQVAHDSPELSTRVLRKRKSLVTGPTKSSNRRISMKPRKHVMIDSSNPKQIEALYLNKKCKTVSQTLETIYEEPKTDSSSSETLIGGRKVKRLLTFQFQCSKEKIKRRRAKIKKMLGNKSFLNRKKIPMNVFMKTIESLELDDVVSKTETTIVTN